MITENTVTRPVPLFVLGLLAGIAATLVVITPVVYALENSADHGWGNLTLVCAAIAVSLTATAFRMRVEAIAELNRSRRPAWGAPGTLHLLPQRSTTHRRPASGQ